MRLWLVYTQALHEPAVLLRSQASRFTFLPGPLESTRLQSFVQQDKSVTFPVQCFDPVPSSAAEEEQCVGEGIQLELLLNKRRQSVYPTAQICVAASDIHPFRAGEVGQHDFNTRSTASTVAASAPEWISASTLAIRTVTATFPERTDCTGVTSAN